MNQCMSTPLPATAKAIISVSRLPLPSEIACRSINLWLYKPFMATRPAKHRHRLDAVDSPVGVSVAVLGRGRRSLSRRGRPRRRSGR